MLSHLEDSLYNSELLISIYFHFFGQVEDIHWSKSKQYFLNSKFGFSIVHLALVVHCMPCFFLWWLLWRLDLYVDTQLWWYWICRTVFLCNWASNIQHVDCPPLYWLAFIMDVIPPSAEFINGPSPPFVGRKEAYSSHFHVFQISTAYYVWLKCTVGMSYIL